LDSINSYGYGGFVSSGKWKEFVTKDFKPSKKTANDPVKDILEKGITPGGLELDPASSAIKMINKLFGSSENKQLAQQRKLEQQQKEQQDKLMKMREEQMLMQQRMQEDMMKMQEQMMKDSMKMQEVMKDRMMMQNTSFEPISFKPTSFKPTSFEPTSFEPTSFEPTSFNFTPAVYDGKMPSFLLDNSEESGLVARRDSSSMSYSSASSDLSESLRDGVTVSNNLLRRLITVLQDKDLSVTVVDTEGNEKDQSTYLIKRQNQLEYRNATELA